MPKVRTEKRKLSSECGRGSSVFWTENRSGAPRRVVHRPRVGFWGRRDRLGGQTSETARMTVCYSPRFPSKHKDLNSHPSGPEPQSGALDQLSHLNSCFVDHRILISNISIGKKLWEWDDWYKIDTVFLFPALIWCLLLFIYQRYTHHGINQQQDKWKFWPRRNNCIKLIVNLEMVEYIFPHLQSVGH